MTTILNHRACGSAAQELAGCTRLALADSSTKSGSAMHGTRNTQFLPRALVDSFVS